MKHCIIQSIRYYIAGAALLISGSIFLASIIVYYALSNDLGWFTVTCAVVAILMMAAAAILFGIKPSQKTDAPSSTDNQT